MAMGAEVIKFVGEQCAALSAERAGAIISSVRMDDARVLANTGAINDLAQKCLDLQASICARTGDFPGLANTYKGIGTMRGAFVDMVTGPHADERNRNSGHEIPDRFILSGRDAAQNLDDVVMRWWSRGGSNP